jgi:hypothetical protein
LLKGARSIPNIHTPNNQNITFDAINEVAEKEAPKYIAVTIKSPIIKFGNIESNDLSFEETLRTALLFEISYLQL